MHASVAASRHILLVFILAVRTANSQTCYYASGQVANSQVVPCGSGTSACCQLGDICLANSACYNVATKVTYLYGCTDTDYAADICPWKCGVDFTNAPYVGITYCTLNGGSLWSCTKPPSDNSNVQAQPGQDCASDSQVAFAGSASLQPVLSLPSSAGGSTGYFSPGVSTVIPNYTPAKVPVNNVPSKPSTPEAVVPAPTTTTSSRKSKSDVIPVTSTAASTSTTPSSTVTSPVTSAASTTSSAASVSSPRASSSTTSVASSNNSSAVATSSSSLSTGAKAAIGAGIAGAALFLLAVGLLFFLRRKKKLSHEPVPQHDPTYPAHEPKTPYQDHPPVIPSIANVEGRSELPGDTTTRHPGKHLSSELGDTSLRFNSPAQTYTSWETTQRPPHHGVHELGTNF